jgi:thioredoxin-like negative regulator of GroEL
MRRTRTTIALSASTLLLSSLALGATQQRSGPPPGVRFGRVTTASAVTGWGVYVAKTEFLPGDRLWVYAETYGTARNGRADLIFHFRLLAADGASIYDGNAEFNEATTMVNWGAWRAISLPAKAAVGTYTLQVDVLNRATGEKGTKAVTFAVVSATRTLPTAVQGGRADDTDPDSRLAAEELSPEMEEAFALLRQRRYEEAVKIFRRALGKEKPSARGYLGLARTYEGLNAYKNVLDTCDKLIAVTDDPKVKAIAHNTKGVAYFSRASDRGTPPKEDLAAAGQEFRTTLELDPDFHMARYNMGTLMLKAGDDAAGIEWLRAYVAAAPTGSAAKDAERLIENPRRARENFAPDFSLVTLEGEHVDLESLRGQVVVIDFWATWCAPCREALPFLRTIQKRLAGQPVVMISVSVDTDAAAARAMIASEKMSWRQYIDTTGRLGRTFAVRSIPTTLVIDGDGVIRQRLAGFTRALAMDVEDAVRKSLKTAAPKRP